MKKKSVALVVTYLKRTGVVRGYDENKGGGTDKQRKSAYVNTLA